MAYYNDEGQNLILIVVGFAMMLALSSGYLFGDAKYFLNNGKEVSENMYYNHSFSTRLNEFTVKRFFEIEPALVAGIATLSLGFILIGLTNRGKEK